MAEFTVKIAFWLRAFDSFTIEAQSDDEAIARARTMALQTMQSVAAPEHIDLGARRAGIIAYIDHVTAEDHRIVAEDVEFDPDRIHPAPEA